MSKLDKKTKADNIVETEEIKDTEKETIETDDSTVEANDGITSKDSDSSEETKNNESEEVQDNTSEDSEDNSGEEKSKKKKDAKDIAIEELQDKVLRQMAEFDNFRKRTEKEKSSMFEMGATDIIKKLLPIVDNFERGFKSVSEEEMEVPFVKGMDMIYKQMIKMLEDAGVKAIEAVGTEFNPDYYNAVMHIEDDSVGENIIVEEFEKGYTYRETVIRHSMVKVAN